MLPFFQPPSQPPQSAVEAVALTNSTLQAAGFTTSRATLTEPAQGSAPFSGTVIELTLLEAELDKQFAEHASRMAADQGAKVTASTLRLRQLSMDSLKLEISISAKVMLATIQARIEGIASWERSTEIHLHGLRLDAGSGMFASMISAALTPALSKAEGRKLPLEDFAGAPAAIRSVNIQRGVLRAELEYSA